MTGFTTIEIAEDLKKRLDADGETSFQVDMMIKQFDTTQPTMRVCIELIEQDTTMNVRAKTIVMLIVGCIFANSMIEKRTMDQFRTTIIVIDDMEDEDDEQYV